MATTILILWLFDSPKLENACQNIFWTPEAQSVENICSEYWEEVYNYNK